MTAVKVKKKVRTKELLEKKLQEHVQKVKHLKNNIRGLETSLLAEKWTVQRHQGTISYLHLEMKRLHDVANQKINKRWALFLSGSFVGYVLSLAAKSIWS